MRPCVICEEPCCEEEFHSKGRGVRDSACKHCRNTLDREKYAAELPDDRRLGLASRRLRREDAASKGLVGSRAFSAFQKDRRVAWLTALKSGPCTDCGQQFPKEVMEFDHLGEKKFDISFGVFHKSVGVVLAELKKCELVCANCHRLRTARRRGTLTAPPVMLDYEI